jgi:hypothetical protein
MANWLFDRDGQPRIIHDSDCLRDRHGRVCAWLSGGNVYSTRGRHVGWFEEGVIYDSHNRAIGFLADASGSTPARPVLAGAPGMPSFAGRPGRPGFAGAPGRPGKGGWSSDDLESYFKS